MQGFFAKSELQGGCGYLCRMSKGAQFRLREGGNLDKGKILFVFDRPMREYGDELGRLEEFLPRGVDPSLFAYTYAVRCSYEDEIDNKKGETCAALLWRLIQSHRFKVIVLLGDLPLHSICRERWKEGLDGIDRWRGWAIPDRKAKAFVLPTYSPEYVNDNEGYPALKTVLRQDIVQAVKCLQDPLPDFCKRDDDTSLVTVLEKPRDILDVVNHLLVETPEGTLVSFDYETTGRKPYRKGHDIVTCSFCADPDRAYAFPFDSPRVRELWCLVLKSKRLRKTAHQMKFEELWSREILKTPVVGWRICTCLGAHIEDNRQGVTGLKFQAAVRFGIYDYSKAIESLLGCVEREDVKYGANGINQIRKIPIRKLCLYNGLDSLYGKWLAHLQIKEMV